MTKRIFSFLVNRCQEFWLKWVSWRSRRNGIFRFHQSYFALLLLGVALSLILLHPHPVGAQEGGRADRGLEFYKNEQYAKAVEAWQAELVTSPKIERQAHLYIFLCLAYQHLGRWDEAKAASDRSFQLLATSENPLLHAKAFNTLAQLQWAQGKMSDALATWQKAHQDYMEARDEEGAMGAQLNQAVALEALGRSYDGNRLLEQLYEQLQQQPPTEVKGRIYLKLGGTRRRLGELEKARKVLEEGVAIANSLRMDALLGELELELGNTARSLANQQSAIGNAETAERLLQTASEHYARAASTRYTPVQLHACINQLNLAADTGSSPDLSLVPKINALLETMPVNRTTTEARLNYAQTLSCWQVKIDPEIPACTRSEWRNVGREKSTATPKLTNLDAIYQLVADSLRAAESLQDSRFRAAALGQLGALYEQNHQWQEAEVFTVEALKESRIKGTEELLYNLSWQLARLQKKQARKAEALVSYQNSVESLQRVRKDLLTLNADVQFSFRDNVEPVYREYVNLLLEEEGEIKPNREKLTEAIAAIDRLQLAEIENFLRCDLSSKVKKVSIDSISDPNAILIYPIITDRGIMTLFKLHNLDWDYRFTQINPSQELETALIALRQSLAYESSGRTPEVKSEAQKLYNWLFKPLETVLTRHPNLETLVFVLDASLRNIPMTVLYDGKEYLIQKKYTIAMVPSLQLFPPQKSTSVLSFASGGIGFKQTLEGEKFTAISKLRQEINFLPQPNHSLFNKKFTVTQIQEQLQGNEVSAIHWKTHGLFSSDPEETYIVAFQQLIKARDFDRLIALGSKEQTTPLELLVLSSCHSAEGDKRAVLGLAGIAARSGSKTTISTLWRIKDNTNTTLMKYFYDNLKAGNSKVKSLKLAQQAILNDKGTQSPYHWAAYTFIGNWL